MPKAEPVVFRRLRNRFKDTTKAYIISVDDWDTFFQTLAPEIQSTYTVHGFWDMRPDGGFTREQLPDNLGVIAMTFKGICVVSYVDAGKVLIALGRKHVVVL